MTKMKITARITMKGAYGNSNGSGEAQDTLPNLPNTSPASTAASITTFYTTISDLFLAEKGDVYITATDEFTPDKPENDINIDELLIAEWTPDGMGRPRKLTIQGATPGPGNSTQEAAGLRLSPAGKEVLRVALNAAYGVSTATVPRGKFIRRA